MTTEEKLYAAIRTAVSEHDATVRELNLSIQAKDASIKETDEIHREAIRAAVSEHDAAVRELKLSNQTRIQEADEIHREAIRAAVSEHDAALGNLRVEIDSRDSKIEYLEREKQWFTAKVDADSETMKELQASVDDLEKRFINLESEKALIVNQHAEDIEVIQKDNREGIAGRDVAIATLQRQFDAFIAKSEQQIDLLNSEIKGLVTEHDSEVAHWQREHRRVSQDLEKRTNEFVEELKERNDSVAELSEKHEKSLREHERYVELIRLDQENAGVVHSGELEKLRNQLQDTQAAYQEERKITKRIWATLGYDMDKDSPPKPIHELVRDKDLRISSLEQGKESLADKYSDEVTALNLQIGNLEKRQESMQSTIEHYKGLKDVSELAVRLLDTLEREQWAGNKEALGEIIAEGRQIVLAAK